MERVRARSSCGCLIGIVLLVDAFGMASLAQPAHSSIVDLPPEKIDLWEHRLGPEAAVHVTAEEFRPLQPGMVSLEFQIVVSANGRVESAKLIGDQRVRAEEGRAIEMERLFKPWLIDGTPTAVRITDYVSILPPEQWAAGPMPFPQSWQLQGASVRLTRTTCYGTCPRYEVTIAGDGTVHFSGHDFVLVPGDHVAHIRPSAVRDLIIDFQKANFFSAMDEYAGGWTDNPTQTLTLVLDGRTKKLVDYVGTEAGMPLAIRNLESEVDEAAGADRWIKGNETTLPSLKAEHWPFSAATQQNALIYNSALRSANQPLIDQFLAAHAPIVTPVGQAGQLANGERIASPVCTASSTGDLDLVERMLHSTPKHQGLPSKPSAFPHQVLDECLRKGALSGSVDVAAYWLDHGADSRATANLGMAGWSALASAVQSGNPDVVKLLLDHDADVHAPAGEESILAFALERRGKETVPIVSMLIQAGADVNARNGLGQTPLFVVGFAPDAVKLLLAAGAKINTRDRNGSTPLMNVAFIEPAVRELLANGADPAVANHAGDTASKMAHQYGCEPCAALIGEALKKHAGSESSSVTKP